MILIRFSLQENSLSQEILRKVAPKEAEFLNDKTSQIRVRFR